MNRSLCLTPVRLGCCFTGAGVKEGDECRVWMKRHSQRWFGRSHCARDHQLRAAPRIIATQESVKSLAALADFIYAAPGRYLPITMQALDRAAELWAETRGKLVETDFGPASTGYRRHPGAQVLVGRIDSKRITWSRLQATPSISPALFLLRSGLRFEPSFIRSAHGCCNRVEN